MRRTVHRRHELTPREPEGGHSVRSAEDRGDDFSLPFGRERHLAASGVTLEVAITSNVQAGAAPSRARAQLEALVAAGVRVALCTDNPAVSDTRLTREYEQAHDLVAGRTGWKPASRRLANRGLRAGASVAPAAGPARDPLLACSPRTT